MSLLTDLETRVGRSFSEAEEPQAEAILDYAAELAAAETGCDWDDESDIPAPIARVIVEMAFRSIANPMGVTQDTTGPFTVSFGAQAAQRIYLTAGDRKILAANACRSPLQVLRTTRGPIETRSVLGDEW